MTLISISSRNFFKLFANEVACNLHIRLEYGDEPHHVAEAIFKGFAKALDLATQAEPRLAGKVPSTKGTLPSNLTTPEVIMKKVGSLIMVPANLRSVS